MLAERDVEVELCSEILRAVEELTTRSFDAIISDWDEGAEGAFLLRTSRELKTTRTCQALALVSDAAGAAGAIQSGAHGVVHRPIATQEVEEAISALRELVASKAAEKNESAKVVEITRKP